MKLRKAEQLDSQDASPDSSQKSKQVARRLRLPRLSMAFNKRTLIGSALVIVPLLIFVSVLNVRWFSVIRYLSDRIAVRKSLPKPPNMRWTGWRFSTTPFPR